jgi:hypothetical protein
VDLDCAALHSAWFETAIDCAAFLAYRLNLRGARVRFRTAEFDVRLPQEGDIHTILNYLALVSPRVGAPSEGPDESGCVNIVFTPNIARLAEKGWAGTEHSRLLGPSAFARSETPPAGGNA